MDSLSKSNALAYVLVGILTSATTILVTLLNRKYAKRIKPERSQQTGYSEWVAYLEREIKALKEDNKRLNDEIEKLKQSQYEKDNTISRMRNKLLEVSRKYDEDVSGII